MAKNKFYAVKYGRKIGIFNNWDDAKKQVTGFNEAIYKSFTNLEDAKAFLDGIDVVKKKNYEEKEKIITKINNIIDFMTIDDVIAFVGSSCSREKLCYSFGIIYMTKNKREECFNVFEDNETDYLVSNILGEIQGVCFAIKKAVEENKKKITICYDYDGIENWINGNWKAKTKMAIEYRDFISKYSWLINIDFLKTKSDFNISHNKKALELAKKVINYI